MKKLQNLQRIVILVLLMCVFIVPTTGCASEAEECPPEEEFENMEITKIETSWEEGFAPFYGYYLRTFDFKKGKVYDTIVKEQDIAESLAATTEYKADDFNKPKQVATFTQDQAIALYENINALGFFEWEDKYITEEIIPDVGKKCVTVFFQNGIVKKTVIFLKDPPNYSKIRDAFEQYLGVSFYYNK